MWQSYSLWTLPFLGTVGQCLTLITRSTLELFCGWFEIPTEFVNKNAPPGGVSSLLQLRMEMSLCQSGGVSCARGGLGELTAVPASTSLCRGIRLRCTGPQWWGTRTSSRRSSRRAVLWTAKTRWQGACQLEDLAWGTCDGSRCYDSGILCVMS